MVLFSIILLVIVAILLMAVVLLQSSKGTGLSGSFGGSGIATSFGVRRTSDFLTKSTTILAVIFLLGSLILNIFINKGSSTDAESIIQRNAGNQPQQQAPPPVQTPPPTQQNSPGTQQNGPSGTPPTDAPAK
ncbi:MAG: preprotein translocase subunit SecG [Bacteroidetes bacterium]|nr:preprotein translocase subunit SecG [Bacteroidota bacterium]